MTRPHLAQGIILSLSLAYLLSAVAIVSTTQAPVCDPTQAVFLRFDAHRSWAEHDDLRASRMYLAATTLVLGCRSADAVLAGLSSLGQAGAMYALSRYEHEHSLLDRERSRLASLSVAISNAPVSINPYEELYRPIIVALDRVNASMSER